MRSSSSPAHPLSAAVSDAQRRSGEAYFQSVFHKSRSLCCADVREPDSCLYALHDEGSASLFAATRGALAQGHVCVTYSFLMDYAAIVAQMRAMTTPQNDSATTTTTATTNEAHHHHRLHEVLPTRLVTSAGLHTMREHNASHYKAEVEAFLTEAGSPAWRRRGTLLAVHTIAAPNYTAVAAGGHRQTAEAVASFNAALREAAAAATDAAGASASASRLHRVLRLVDLHAVTSEAGGAERAQDAQRRFPRLDAMHFRDQFYQAAFVADALALYAAQCARDAAWP